MKEKKMEKKLFIEEIDWCNNTVCYTCKNCKAEVYERFTCKDDFEGAPHDCEECGESEFVNRNYVGWSKK